MTANIIEQRDRAVAELVALLDRVIESQLVDSPLDQVPAIWARMRFLMELRVDSEEHKKLLSEWGMYKMATDYVDVVDICSSLYPYSIRVVGAGEFIVNCFEDDEIHYECELFDGSTYVPSVPKLVKETKELLAKMAQDIADRMMVTNTSGGNGSD